jgi:drug/metabolite transporter (DMT)-like permease
MLAIVGGLGAAVVFAAVTLINSRASGMIGPTRLLGWVMLVGLAIVGPLAALEGVPDGLDGDAVTWLIVAGVGNVVGLLLAYAALRSGKVGIVAPIVSTQGAVAAVIAVIAGESLAPGTGVLLALIALGVFVAGTDGSEATSNGGQSRAAVYAVAAAVAIGASLYATGRASVELPVVWALLPSRALGFLAVTVPLLLRQGLRIGRDVLPLVVASGVCEVAGFALFAWGARHGIAVTAVLASLFGAIAATAAYFLFRERLARVQLVAIAVIVIAVAVLSGVQA